MHRADQAASCNVDEQSDIDGDSSITPCTNDGNITSVKRRVTALPKRYSNDITSSPELLPWRFHSVLRRIKMTLGEDVAHEIIARTKWES